MCSVGWEWKAEKHSDAPGSQDAPVLTVFFNRDEQRTRAFGTPPETIKVNGVNALMPIDPARGGTWISTNEHGITLCLLNLYSVPPTPGKAYSSRGQLVKTLSDSTDLHSVSHTLANLTTSEMFPAFTLIAWCSTTRRHLISQWNETSLTDIPHPHTFYTSSSWNTEEVQQYRQDSYLEQVCKNHTSLEEFMTHTPEGREKWSVRMSREKTQTVSFTKIEISSTKASIQYQDRHSPQTQPHTLSLRLSQP